jgi:zeaxanthin glucosyltransferase
MQGEDVLELSVRLVLAQTKTILESLPATVVAQGVPQIAIPVAYDQPGVAARIAHRQTGVVTSLDQLTADHLSSLLNKILTNSTYRDNARELQKAIVEANGLTVAADLVEESLGVRRSSRRPAATAGRSVIGTQSAAAKLDPRKTALPVTTPTFLGEVTSKT